MKYTSGLPLICKMVKTMMPAVRRELAGWRLKAERISDAALRAQALASLKTKSFHCQGGGVYALYPGANFDCTLKFIVAFQTTSDYLDNLCDRAGVFDEAAFRLLHQSMLDAVDIESDMGDYYNQYPHKDDGGYLAGLVSECRRQVGKLASFAPVKDRMKQLVSLYCELQVFKHIRPSLREEALIGWAAPIVHDYPEITVWEFCAAAGSTLGVFLLFAAAQDPALTSAGADALLGAYFPWVCALHILLDYYIDAEEDEREGDFNFTGYYRDAVECARRLSFFADRALSKCSGLRYAGFHKTIIKGLLALYLSDNKAGACKKGGASRSLVRHGGMDTSIYYTISKILRALGKL